MVMEREKNSICNSNSTNDLENIVTHINCKKKYNICPQKTYAI